MNLTVILLLVVMLIINGQVPIHHASFVQAAVGSSAVVNPGVCTYSSNVTSGDVEVLVFSPVGGAFISVTSTRVPGGNWNLLATTNHSVVYYGIPTSSGAETIDVNMSGSTGIEVVCGEWNTNTNDQLAIGNSGNTATITTTHAISDLVCVGAGGAGGGVTMNSPFTVRASNGSTNILLGDEQVTSAGSQTCTIGAGFPYIVLTSFYLGSSASARHRLIEH